MNTAIKIENLGKRYMISHQRKAPYVTFREVITEKTKQLTRRMIHPLQPTFHKTTQEELWALKNISFDVNQGEKIGIIGRNGAGKTTLLKVLSRITEPTTGRVTIQGRVASLLEVGTGFHPELTGRENIFLNGAILGMTKAEIKKKFDEIIAFAELEKFLDTPVKRYSSGMYVRLAFAVAAHLEPEILVVDEVLAVGDFDFQKKCLGKMEEVGREGRTVLFVSHRMPQIASLCSKAILLDEGDLIQIGTPTEVINTYYHKQGFSAGCVDFTKAKQKVGNEKAQLLRGRILNENEKVITECLIGEPFIVEMEYRVLKEGLSLNPNFHFYDPDGTLKFAISDAPIDPTGERKKQPGKYRARCRIPRNFLNDGLCYIGLALSTMATSEVHFWEKDCLQINIVDPIFGTKTRGVYPGRIPGAVRPLLEWSCEKIENQDKAGEKI